MSLAYQYRSIAIAVSAVTLLAGAVQFAVAADIGTSALATADQRAVESLAIKLLASPEMKKEKGIAYRYFLDDPIAKRPDGRATLQKHIDNLAFVHALGAANSDPARPRVIWYFTAPLEMTGYKIPGSRWGFDNPDNVYRFATIDGASKYAVTVHPTGPGAVQASAMIFDSFCGGQDTKQRSIWLDQPIAATLFGDNIQREADGSFTLTVDSEPANGRPNHLQGNADSKILMFRETFNDWENQKPARIEIRRISGPKATKPPSEGELARRAAYYLKNGIYTISRLIYNGFYVNPFNEMQKPFIRGGGHGLSATGKFNLADGEALLVTLDPLGGQYLGFDIADPWTVTFEHIKANGSLNNNQASPNRDGTYTYVISAQDPGIRNWLDTEGFREGTIFIRWQALAKKITSTEGAIREVKLVKLDDLPRLLPPETVKVTPDQRKVIYAQRAQAYANRYLPN